MLMALFCSFLVVCVITNHQVHIPWTLLRIVTRPRLIEQTILFYGEDVAGGVNEFSYFNPQRPCRLQTMALQLTWGRRRCGKGEAQPATSPFYEAYWLRRVMLLLLATWLFCGFVS